MVRTLGDDLKEGGYKGNYYLYTQNKEYIYEVLGVVWNDEEDIHLTFIEAKYYYLNGNFKADDSMILGPSLKDPRVPDGWKPKSDLPERGRGPFFPNEDWGPFGKNPYKKGGDPPHPYKKY